MAEVMPLPAETPQGKRRVRAANAEEVLHRRLHGSTPLSEVTPLMPTPGTRGQRVLLNRTFPVSQESVPNLWKQLLGQKD